MPGSDIIDIYYVSNSSEFFHILMEDLHSQDTRFPFDDYYEPLTKGIVRYGQRILPVRSLYLYFTVVRFPGQ